MVQSKFENLVEIMAKLRSQDGCPWDREQTYQSIKNYLIEEAYEAVEAIEDDNFEALCEELGDVLLQVVFLAQLASEEKRFTIDEVVEAIIGKMVRRHPHVFGDAKVANSDEVLKNWEQMKQAERIEKQATEPADSAKPAPSILDGVTRRIPAVLEAHQLSQRAARVGFDWTHAEEILNKLHEEIEELKLAMKGAPETSATPTMDERREARVEDEIGDIIFVAVNLARHFKVDPELALKRTNQKFRNRFRYIEMMLAQANKSFDQASLEELEEYWQEAKRNERSAK